MKRKTPKQESSRADLILGRTHTQHRNRMGFASVDRLFTDGELITYSGDGHLMTVAPTRSGKGVGVVNPILLTYSGPVFVVDPKAEAYLITERRRREMGHQVVRLDPFGVVESDSDSLNPLDVFGLTGADLESDAQMLAELIATSGQSTKEPFWDIHGKAAHSALFAHAGTENKERRTVNSVVDAFHGEDVTYRLAVLLDTAGKDMNQMAYNEIAATLSMPEVTRGGVLATAQSYVKAFMSRSVRKTLERSSFSLSDVVNGAPLSIYIIIPPDRLVSHRSLLKLWIGTLMKAVLSRRHQPPLKTLFLIDEAAQLGNFPMLETLTTLAAGYGVWVHTIWQDLSQIRTHYPSSWRTILNNCAVVQTFGIYNRDIANQWSDYLDTGPHELRNLRPDEQLITIHGQGDTRCRRLNYLTDALFDGLFDSNRYYARGKAEAVESPKEIR